MDTTLRKVSLGLMMLNLGIAYCEPALSNQYGVPGNFRGGNNQIGGGNGGLNNHIYEDGKGNEDYANNEPKSYEFGYAVKDQATGNDFGRQESSDGETVRGEYRVQLPDGRTQIVTYTADWRTGFHADVRYEGTATYPEQFNRNNGLNGNDNAGQGFGYQGHNIPNSYNGGNNAGAYNNNYRGNSGGYNQGGNNYQYQFGSNGLENNFGTRTGFSSNLPSPTYGPGFH